MRKISKLVKSAILLLGGSLVTLMGLTGCENFLQGSDTRKQLDELIRKANAPKANIKITLGSADYGMIYPQSYTGTEGEEFTVEFTKREGVFFKMWTCLDSNGVPSDAVTFSNQTYKKDTENNSEIYTVKVTIKKTENIVIRPKCYPATDGEKPELTDCSLFAKDKTTGKYTKKIESKEFSQWSMESDGAYTYGDFSKYHMNNTDFLFKVYGKDELSGLGDVQILETYYKSVAGADTNALPRKTLLSVDESCQKNADGSYSASYSIKSFVDGVIKLEVSLLDNCGNESEQKAVYYILKDTTVVGDLFFTSGTMDGQGWNETLSDNSNYTLRKVTDGKDFISEKIEKNKLNDTFYTGCSIPYDIKVFWGYSEDQMTQIQLTPDSSGNKVYSFEKDCTKIAYVKCVAKDDLGNQTVFKRAVLPQFDFGLDSVRLVSQYYTETNSPYYRAIVYINPYEETKYKNLCKSLGAEDFIITLVYNDGDGYGIYYKPEYNSFSYHDKGESKDYYVIVALKYNDGSYWYSPLSTTYVRFTLSSSYNGSTTTGIIKQIKGKTIASAPDNLYIKNNIKINATPVKNSGNYLITVDDYKTAAGKSNTDVQYRFICANQSTLEKFINTEPQFYLPSNAEYKIAITSNLAGSEYMFSPISFYLNGSSTLASGNILILDQDITPPTFGSVGNYYKWYESSPAASMIYQNQGTHPYNPDNPDFYKNSPDVNHLIPSDETQIYSSAGSGEITYYFLPNKSDQTHWKNYITYSEEELSAFSAKTVTYDLNQLDYTIPQMMARTQNDFSESEIDCRSTFKQMRIEIPYDGLEEGFYTLCIKAKDMAGNYSFAFSNVLNRTMGSKLDWTYNTTAKTITFGDKDQDKGLLYYYDFETKRWVSFYGYLDTWGYTAYELIALHTINDKQGWFNGKWAKIITAHDDSSNLVSKSGFYDVEYAYVDYKRFLGTANEITCHRKNIYEGGSAGLDVFADAPVMAHVLYCSKKLTETHTSADATVWLNKAMEVNPVFETTTFTYSYENLQDVPAGSYYTIIVHYADGSVIMTDIKQK